MKKRRIFCAFGALLCVYLLSALGLMLPEMVHAQSNPEDLSDHISDIHKDLRKVEKVARSAARARSMDKIKSSADEVYQLVWGISSDLTSLSAEQGAASVHGWKVRWQTDYTPFDPAFAARYGSEPAALPDAQTLGIVGRGRHVRRSLSSGSQVQKADEYHAFITGLNNVIGWQRLDDGVTKAERQPRIDLTYRWDAPNSFFQGEADTGWVFAVQSQALNILKTDYGDDLGMARRHMKDLAALARRCLRGSDGEPGFNAAMRAAKNGGLVK